MFTRLFKKQIAVKRVQQSRKGIQFSGQTTGEWLNCLRMKLAPRLQSLNRIENGYLPRLQYSGENSARDCLILVERNLCTKAQKLDAATTCSGIVPMDICFASDLPGELVFKVTSVCRPILLPNLSFFECPLIVKRGSNDQMPPSWPQGITYRYVAALNFEDALLHAVASAESDGFEFIGVYQGKVTLIDHRRWWADVVMQQWRRDPDRFPSQAQVEAAVATGGLFRGPTVGPLLSWH